MSETPHCSTSVSTRKQRIAVIQFAAHRRQRHFQGEKGEGTNCILKILPSKLIRNSSQIKATVPVEHFSKQASNWHLADLLHTVVNLSSASLVGPCITPRTSEEKKSKHCHEKALKELSEHIHVSISLTTAMEVNRTNPWSQNKAAACLENKKFVWTWYPWVPPHRAAVHVRTTAHMGKAGDEQSEPSKGSKTKTEMW